GIYWMMPLLAAATWAAIRLVWRRAPGGTLAALCAVFPLATIFAVMFWAFDLSGGAYNIRHALACVAPLYCVLAHPALVWTPRLRLGAWIMSGWAFLIAALGVVNPWSHNTLSAIPPLENVARLCLAHPAALPSDWIGGLVDTTSV